MSILHLVADPISSLKKSIEAIVGPALGVRESVETVVAPERDIEESNAAFVNIRYLGSVRATTGERELRWEKPEATLRQLLRDLAIHYGPRFRYWVLDRGNQPGEHIIVRINGHNAQYLGGADTPLHTGDTITVASKMRLRPIL